MLLAVVSMMGFEAGKQGVDEMQMVTGCSRLLNKGGC